MASEAKAISAEHQTWIIQLLKANNGQCTYEEIVKEGENHHCDTVGAMLKILKQRRVIDYKPQFLMYPMNKLETITLINGDYHPSTAV